MKRTREPGTRGRGRLMYGRLGSLGGGRGGSKSAMDGSGVVMRNELIYLASAISRFSSISSRSSMSRASACVSLT